MTVVRQLRWKIDQKRQNYLDLRRIQVNWSQSGDLSSLSVAITAYSLCHLVLRSGMNQVLLKNAARVLRLLSPAWLALIVVGLGCSGGSMDQNTIQSGEVGLQEAIKMVESNQCSQALPILEKSISEGGLNADLLSLALVQRARCHIEAGNTEAAAQDLDRAEQGAAPQDQFHLVKGLLLRKQGKAQEATAEFSKAKKLSPKIKIPQ